jgi:hypothetical protein
MMFFSERVTTAQWASRCRSCQKWIAPGMPMRYGRADGARHLDETACAAALPDDPRGPFTGDRDVEVVVVHQLLAGAEWRFAVTMPTAPHHYTLRRQWPDTAAFDRCVVAIRQLGTRRRWKTMVRPYLDVGGQSFWVMEPAPCPAALSPIINRADRPDDGDG